MAKKIGILCASDTELEPFLERLTDKTVTQKSMLSIYEGKYEGTGVVALYSGVCKVNAAIATQILIDCFQVDMVINAGVAGGIDERVKLFDTVISEQSAYHDMTEDILTEFHPWLKTIYFPSDERLVAIAKEYAPQTGHPVLFGKTMTGEQFVAEDKREELRQKYAPLSVDMETAAVAHVCYVNGIPFIGIRTITDTASHDGMENFEKNCETASRISAEVVLKLLKQFAQL